MSKKKELPFTAKELSEYSPDDIRLNLIQDGDEVYRCTVDEKKKILGLFCPHWVHRADLLKPIRDVDAEIQRKKDELKALVDKRETKMREARILSASIDQSYKASPYKLTAKDSKPDSVSGLFNSPPEKKEKKKVPLRVLEGVKATAERTNNNNGKRNNN